MYFSKCFAWRKIRVIILGKPAKITDKAACKFKAAIEKISKATFFQEYMNFKNWKTGEFSISTQYI